MRISELAETSGIPLATVKYYLREGLLPPGRAVSARMSDYDVSHVRRLRLLRVLREVGDVPVTRLQEVARAIEEAGSDHEMLGAAAEALAPPPAPAGPLRESMRTLASEVVADAGWQVTGASTPFESLAAVLESLVEYVPEPDPTLLAPYVRAADELARHEIALLDLESGREALMEQMVVGQVLLGRLLDTLRRLAEEHHSAQRFG
jgi:DNA-binding transcriptional MerR regulator